MEMVWRLRETHSLMNNMIVCLTIWIILKNKCKKEMKSSKDKSNFKNMALMFDRSGKNRKIERELLAKGSEMSFAANLAKLAVRRNSYW